MFERELNEQILRALKDKFYWIDTGDFIERYDIRMQIACQHNLLTFLPYSDLSLDFMNTYSKSLAMNFFSLIILPFFTLGRFLVGCIDGDAMLFLSTFEFIFNVFATLIILAFEITSGILSLATKPLITLGFLIAYTADFMLDFFKTDKNIQNNNNLYTPEALDALLLLECSQ